MTSRPSYCQLEGLVDFLEQNPSIAKGLLRTLGGAIKDGQGWAKYWAEKKWALKKQCAQTSALMRRTGGGAAYSLPALSALDKRLVVVMGGLDFAAGDQWSFVPASSTPLPSNIPRPRRRVVRTMDSLMERFSHIQARRVEAEMTAAQALAKIAEALLSVGDAQK
ncbi:unnamed protein product [Arctia plantaginis]|uniref:Uncharacterized protein n=1 Tax=Arctia plantaginis TaxID=874455 RepID=A0A8S1B6X4_ARCPL|nr:unnamed protein product [Arctia plantaginis]CAB3253801.1 unnamed protein product [Arctia plantaginis]